MVGGILAVIVGLLIAANAIRVPYYTLSPGSTRRTEDLVRVEGTKSHVEDAGSVSYTTVSFAPATVWSYLTAKLDPSTDVIEEKQALHGQDPDENRRENLELMDSSKQAATVAALRKLGYQVTARGTGAVVTGLSEGSPSQGKLEVGDAIVAVDQAPIGTADELVAAIRARRPGDTVTFTVEEGNGGDKHDVAVTLGARPDDANRAFIGINLGTRSPTFEYPFSVGIDSGQVGGPSAGLAFSLGVIDLLTPGDLTGGRKVATTGTIDVNGRVGPVGGVKQKTFAVRKAGASLFLVPRDEYDEARQYAEDLKVVPVDTVDDALEAIRQNGGDVEPVLQAAGAGTTVPR